MHTKRTYFCPVYTLFDAVGKQALLIVAAAPAAGAIGTGVDSLTTAISY